MNTLHLERPPARPGLPDRAGEPRIGDRNVRGGLILLSLGFLAGLLMALYAFRPIVHPPAGFGQYDDLPRRLVRLAHISAIMLPLINIVLGPWIDRLRISRAAKEWASRLLLWGALFFPPAMGLEAAWDTAHSMHVSGLPVVAFCAGIFIVSAGAARTRNWRT